MKTRNLWPFGILLAFVLFIGGTIALIVVACSNTNELVTADYYEHELRFQSQMDRTQRAQQLPAKATVAYEPAANRIVVSLPSHRVGVTGRIELYRPSEASLDRELDLQPGPDGIQTIDASNLKNGLWKVKVTWNNGVEEFFLDTKVVIGAKQT